MTPAEIAEASSCFNCLGDKTSALLYVLARIGGVTIDEIAENSACFNCIPDKESALIYLLSAIAEGGLGGTMQVYQGAFVDPNGNVTPEDPTKPALYFPDGGGTTWQFDVPSQQWV